MTIESKQGLELAEKFRLYFNELMELAKTNPTEFVAIGQAIEAHIRSCKLPLEEQTGEFKRY